MSPKPRSSPASFSQITVVLDTHGDRSTTLRSAIELAAGVQGELLCLFVEDSDLLRAADLPFASEVTRWSAQDRPLNVEEVVRSLRALATRVELELQSAAKEARVRCSFRVVRGPRVQAALDAAERFDVLVLGSGRRRLGPISKRPVALPSVDAVYLLFDGSPASGRALPVAVAVARGAGADIFVWLADSVGGLSEDRLDAKLRETGVPYRIARIPADSLAGRLRNLSGSALVVPEGALLRDPRELALLLAGIRCPVLLVR